MLINLIFILLFLVESNCFATTFNVNTTADQIDINLGDGICQTIDNHCSLRAAIMESNSIGQNVTIFLLAGTYQLSLIGVGENSTLTGDLDITNNLFIIGEGYENTIIDGNGSDRIFDLVPDRPRSVNLINISIINGNAFPTSNLKGLSNEGTGGAIRLNELSTLNLENILMQNNTSLAGGAIHNRGVILGEKIQFINNSGDGAGVYLDGNASQMLISKCLFMGNTGSNGPAAISSRPFSSQTLSRLSLELNQCAFINNTVESNGGIIRNLHSSQTIIRNTTFSGNTGDTILFNDESSTFHLINSTIVNNNATWLVDAHASPLFITLRNNVITDNNPTFCSNSFTSEGGNFIGNIIGIGSCNAIIHKSDIISDADPLLSPLFSFSKPWQQIHLPLLGSPLIDSGEDTLCENTDQIGFQRQQDSNFDGVSHCNIGATAIGDVVFINSF